MAINQEELAAYDELRAKYKAVESEMRELEAKRTRQHFLNRKDQEKWEDLREESWKFGYALAEKQALWREEEEFQERLGCLL